MPSSFWRTIPVMTSDNYIYIYIYIYIIYIFISLYIYHTYIYIIYIYISYIYIIYIYIYHIYIYIYIYIYIIWFARKLPTTLLQICPRGPYISITKTSNIKCMQMFLRLDVPEKLFFLCIARWNDICIYDCSILITKIF